MLTLALAYAGRAGRSLDSGISGICAYLSGGVGSGQKGMGMKQDDADEVFPVCVVVVELSLASGVAYVGMRRVEHAE